MRGSRRGFTMIELLVCVVIIGILLAVALPLYLSSRADAMVKTCRENLRTIANAEVGYQSRTGYYVLGGDLSGLAADLEQTPVCPAGGHYSVAAGPASPQPGAMVPAGSFIVTCSASGHGWYSPGLSSR